MAELLELEVGPVAHGGHCVARHAGAVVFVRHALPGERVLAMVTERRSSYLRADAVEVLTPSPDRVAPPCPHAGPGRCGGCDWQHASGDAQRALKAAVVREQLGRLSGLPDVPVTVEPLPGGLLGWRSRVRYAVSPDGVVGFRRHRSHEVEPVDHCPIATPEVDEVGVQQGRWPGLAELEVVVSSAGDRAVVAHEVQQGARLPQPPEAAVLQVDGRRARRLHGHRAVRERALGRTFRVDAAGFWQVHPAAADVLAGAVLEAVAPRPGDRVLDLYAGVGLFAAALEPRLGAEGALTLVEVDRRACQDATYNLRDATAAVRVERGRVDRTLHRLPGPVDLVVLDPPRSGAGRPVVEQVAARRPRAVAYVACDPAALARDVALFAGNGYRLAGLRAFDLFPMTRHVECVAALRPDRR